MSFVTICLVTYKRYSETKRAIESVINQTDKNFILEVWQDGRDEKKREIVEAFNDNRIRYYENFNRTNLWGHDMTDKSLMNCTSKYFHRMNDDNVISPHFVSIVRSGDGSDLIRHRIVMNNWISHLMHRKDKRVEYESNTCLNVHSRAVHTNKLMRRGETKTENYISYAPVMLETLDGGGQFDACSWTIKTKFAQKYNGWWSRENEADSYVIRKLLGHTDKIKRLTQVLEVHN